MQSLFPRVDADSFKIRIKDCTLARCPGSLVYMPDRFDAGRVTGLVGELSKSNPEAALIAVVHPVVPLNGVYSFESVNFL